MAAKIEKCHNCDRAIGRMEQAYLWQEKVVCAACYARLSAPALPQPACPRPPQPPPQQPPPLPLGKPDVGKKKPGDLTWWQVVGILGLVGGLVVLFASGPCSSDTRDRRTSSPDKISAPEPPDKMSAFLMSQDFVKARLKAPSTAEFPWYDKSFVGDLGGGRFRVNAYVDAQNSFGAQIRSRYTCVLKATGDDRWGNWKLESMDIR